MVVNIKIPKKIIIDASVALSFLLPDERNKLVDDIFISFKKGKTNLFVPSIFHFEVANSLKSAILQKRLNSLIAKRLLVRIIKTNISVVEINWQKTFELSLKHKLSFYDASYLSLAQQEKVPLYSLDKKLQKLS